MKILIFGGSGPIGYYLFKELRANKHLVDATYFTNNMFSEIEYKLDTTNSESTKNLITRINPDLVIDTVALSGVDLAETNHQLADSVTVEGTKNIINGCKITKSKIVYISTTYVFGDNEKIHTEADTPRPANYYGVTKLRAEELVINSGLEYLILRTDQPYGWIRGNQRKNSVIRTLDTLKTGNVLKEITDWYSVPTYLPDFALAACKLVENNESGIFHVTGNDYLSRYEWALQIADVFGLNKKLIVPIESSELKLPAKRSNPNVSNKKLIQRTNIMMKGIKDGLLDMIKNPQI